MSPSSIVFVVAMAVAGCGSGTPASPEPASPRAGNATGSSSQATTAEIELRLDETVEFEELDLQWLELEDSRCPIGVACIWQGQVVVTVEVGRNEEPPIEVELLLRAGDEPEAVEAFDHELLLLGVEPHPKEGVARDRGDYVARLEITRP